MKIAVRNSCRKSLILFFLFLCVELQAAPGEKIREIVVRGNSRIEKEAVLEKLSHKVGQTVDDSQIREDVLAIFSMGFFEDVRVDYEAGGRLVVGLRERPVIQEIKYEGASEFEAKELAEFTGLKAFKVLNISEIKSAQESIAKHYEEKGYYLARADYSVEPIEGAGNRVRLVITVDEGQRVRIRRIFFLGNEVFSSGDLRQNIQSSEGHAFSWATGGGIYREEIFQRDLSLLAFFYGNAGYIQARFSKPRVTLSQDRRYVDIIIDVEEGEQFRLGDVSFNGDLIFSEKELRDSFAMKKDDVFSTGVLQAQVLALTDKYGDKGYAFANVIPRTEIRPGSKVVDLRFDIEKGEKAYWGKIKVTGNSKTHDKVLRRELPFNEGELYNATKRKKGFEKIRRLGFFGEDISFLTSSPEGKNNVIDLEIRVVEKPTGTLNVNAGYGSGQGFIFGTQIVQNNLFGRGQQLSFNLQLAFSGSGDDGDNAVSNSSKTFRLSFTDPHINDSAWLFGFDLFVDEYPVGSSPKTYDKRSSGGSFRLGREVSEDLYLYGKYRLQHNFFRDPVNPDIFTNPDDKETIVSAVSTTLEYDTRNNRLDPSGGVYLSSTAELAGLAWRKFFNWSASARYYQKLVGSFVYRARVEYGILWPWGGDSVPDSQKYILGGIFNLRGWPFYSIGPTRTLSSTRPQDIAAGLGTPIPYTIGGSNQLFTNHEIEFTLIPDANIRAVLFFDAGNAWDSREFGELSPTILSNYGWGIRWYSPLGPLRFEWGYPLVTSPQKNHLGSEFHFIIAPSF